MGSIFNLDGPLMRVLGKFADLMILNLLALACCIPVITAGASLTALHYVSLKLVRGEECYIARAFFKSFKENFRQATIIWLLILLAALIFGLDIYIMNTSGVDFHFILNAVVLAVGLVVLLIATYAFPLLARFDNSVKSTLKNAFFMSLYQFPKTILIIAVNAVALVLVLVPQAIPLVVFFGLSGPAYLTALLNNKFFKKLEARIEEENAPEDGQMPVDPEEDERIFKDELDETLIHGQIDMK